MKEIYFTDENINQVSKEILKQVYNVTRCKKFELNLEQSALLVLDMQEYFINSNSHAYIPSVKPIIPKINKLIEAYNKLNLPIIFTKHLNTNENAKLMGAWWKDIIKKNNNLSELSSNLSFRNSIIIEKTQYDAFYETKLIEILKEKNINQIIITGVMTHLCCETTTRSAFVRGISSVFPVDTTATYNKNFHLSSLLNLAHGFAPIVLSEQIIAKLEEYNIAKL